MNWSTAFHGPQATRPWYIHLGTCSIWGVPQAMASSSPVMPGPEDHPESLGCQGLSCWGFQDLLACCSCRHCRLRPPRWPGLLHLSPLCCGSFTICHLESAHPLHWPLEDQHTYFIFLKKWDHIEYVVLQPAFPALPTEQCEEHFFLPSHFSKNQEFGP